MQVLFPTVAAIKTALPDLDPAAARVLEALLPGPYTFVVATEVPRPELVGTPDSLGVRMPDQPDLLGLLAAIDVPVAATAPTSPAGRRPPRRRRWTRSCWPTARWRWSPEPGSPAAAGIASTVVDLRPLAAGADPIVLREGAVAGETVLGLIQRLAWVRGCCQPSAILGTAFFPKEAIPIE